MDEKWKIIGTPYRYEGGAEPSADVDLAYRDDLEATDGSERKVNVERAAGSGHALTESDGRRTWLRHLRRKAG